MSLPSTLTSSIEIVWQRHRRSQKRLRICQVGPFQRILRRLHLWKHREAKGHLSRAQANRHQRRKTREPDRHHRPKADATACQSLPRRRSRRGHLRSLRRRLLMRAFRAGEDRRHCGCHRPHGGELCVGHADSCRAAGARGRPDIGGHVVDWRANEAGEYCDVGALCSVDQLIRAGGRDDDG